MFSYEYCEISMNNFSDRTPPVAAPVNLSNLEQVRLMTLRFERYISQYLLLTMREGSVET